MANSRRRKKAGDGEHTHLAVKVSGFDAHQNASINSDAYDPRFAWNLDEDDPVNRFTNQLEISGTCTYPENRAGDDYQIIFYGDDAPSRELALTIKDIRYRDKFEAPLYKTYHGRRYPVLVPPKGMGLLEKVRGEALWRGWLHTTPQFVNGMISLLGCDRTLYLAIHEFKLERARWIRRAILQTADPSED